MAGQPLTISERVTAASASAFRPPALLRSPYVQSALGSLPPRSWWVRSRAESLRRRAEELILDCGAGVRLQAFLTRAITAPAGAEPAPLALLLHGWEGSAESPHVLSLGTQLLAQGYDVARLNLRDHGQTHALNRDIFHSCRLPEVVGAARTLAAHCAGGAMFAAGFSLGGNFLLRMAADAGAPSQLAGVVAVSPVLDPQVTLVALEQHQPTYGRYFVRRWSRSLRTKQSAWPGEHAFDKIVQLADLRAMTAGLVALSTEFPDLDAYLQGYAITGERLATLRAPAVMLMAEDDPIIPVADLARVSRSARLRVELSRYGGHCGFIDAPWRASFADRFVCAQFAAWRADRVLARAATHQVSSAS